MLQLKILATGINTDTEHVYLLFMFFFQVANAYSYQFHVVVCI